MRTSIRIPVGRPPSETHVAVTLPRNEFLTEFFPDSALEGLESWAELSSREVGRAGVEALASYVTFRSGPEWGITVKKSGVLGLAGHLSTTTASKPLHAVKAAYRALYDHEMFHFQVDCGYLRLESALAQHGAISDPLGKTSAYLASRSAFPVYDPLEEALANARAVHKMATHRRRRIFVGALRNFLRNSPTGYRDFEQFSELSAFSVGLDALFNIGAKTLDREVLSEGVGRVVDLDQTTIDGSHPPTYLLLDC